jgi:hypothetical protein
MKHRGKKIADHNYLRKLRFMWRTGAVPRSAGLHQVSVSHDDWCGVFQGKRCHCDPDIRLQWSQTAAAQH